MSTKFQIKWIIVGIIFLFPTVANAEVFWYAHLNRGLLHANDGHEKNTFFVDSAYDNSLAGIKGCTTLDINTKVGGQLEIGTLPAASSTSDGVTQLNRSGKNKIDINFVDTWINNDSLGKLSLGYGDMASNSTATVTLSGTDLISYSGVGDMAGSLYLHPQDGSRRVQTSDPQIMTMFNSISGLARKDRLRYDTPKFHGFIVSASVGNYFNNTTNENKYCSDLAITYEGATENFKLKGAVATGKYSKDKDLHTTNFYDGSFAVLHIATGLNAAVAGGRQSHPNDILVPAPVWATAPVTTIHKRNFYYVQFGKQADLTKYGKTNFAIDYYQARHSLLDNDRARAYSFGVVQKVNKIKAEFYAGIRHYKYETPNKKFDRMLAALFGVKISFTGKLL